MNSLLTRVFKHYPSSFALAGSVFRLRPPVDQLDEDFGQGGGYQLEMADVTPCCSAASTIWLGHNPLDLHLDIVLAALDDRHTGQIIQPGCLGVVIQLQLDHIVPVLALDLLYAAWITDCPWSMMTASSPQFLHLLQLVGGKDDRLAIACRS